jgi:hypothetical protein
MLKKSFVVLAMVALLFALLSGCSSSATETTVGESEQVSGPIALEITGKIASEMGWTETELQGMDTIEAEYTGKDGTTNTYTGIPINALLEKAGVQSDASTISFIASDGYQADVPLADVQACQTCIVAFDEEGGLRMVMPDFSSKVQVKGVVEVQVQ